MRQHISSAPHLNKGPDEFHPTNEYKKMPIGRYQYVDVTFPPLPNTPIPIVLDFALSNNDNHWMFMDTQQSDRYVASATAYSDAYPRDITYSGGDYTGNGSLTWTVDSGDLGGNYSYIRNPYSPTYGLMQLCVQIATSSTGGTANTQLLVTLPDGCAAAAYANCKPSYVNEAGTIIDAVCEISANGTQLIFTKTSGANWSNTSTNNLSVYFNITLPVSGIPAPNWSIPRIYQLSVPPTAKISTAQTLMLSCNIGSYSTRLLVWEERNEG